MRLGVEAAIVDGALLAGDVESADGRIAAVALPPVAGGGTAVPGFVDLQVNGFAGVDFATADAAGTAAQARGCSRTGVTAFQPTFITSPEEELVAALRGSARRPDRPARPRRPPRRALHLAGAAGRASGRRPAATRPALVERLLAAGLCRR